MSLVIDIILILAAVAAIYLGIVRGFVKSVMQFASLILATAAVMLFSAPVSAWLNETFISDKVSEFAEESLEGVVGDSEIVFDIHRLLGDSKPVLDGIAERFSVNIDALIEGCEAELASLTEKEALSKLSRAVAEPASIAISDVAAAIIVFVAALIILAILTYVLDLICRLPALEKLNTFLGFLFGVASAAITAFVLAKISIGLISSLEIVNPTVFNSTVIDGSLILRFFVNNGLILL